MVISDKGQHVYELKAYNLYSQTHLLCAGVLHDS